MLTIFDCRVAKLLNVVILNYVYINFTLNETDAFFFEIKNKAIFRQPCKHKQVLDLIITSD